MMKRVKQLLAVMLVMMMTISPLTVSATVSDLVGNPREVTVVPINTFADLEKYSNSVEDIVTMDQGQAEEVMRIEVAKTGALYVYAGALEGATTYPTIGLYKDQEATQSVYAFDSRNGATGATKDFEVSAGVYYLKLSRSDSSTTAKYELAVGNVNGGAKTLAQNKPVLGFSKTGTKNTYYKVSATGTGRLEIATRFESPTGTGYITLCNSSKAALSKKLYVSGGGGSTHYAVKKGTYYVRVSTSSGLYEINRKMATVATKAGATKAKARALSKGGNSVKAKGLMTINDTTKKVDWYKVKLTKKQNVSFQIAGDCTGNISMEIIPAKGRLYGTSKVSLSEYRNSTGIKSSGAWSAGTYYIKVTKGTKAASGYYELYVK